MRRTGFEARLPPNFNKTTIMQKIPPTVEIANDSEEVNKPYDWSVIDSHFRTVSRFNSVHAEFFLNNYPTSEMWRNADEVELDAAQETLSNYMRACQN